jgi:hypothetical protein
MDKLTAAGLAWAMLLLPASGVGAGIVPLEDRRYVHAWNQLRNDYESPSQPFSEFHGNAGAYVGDASQNSGVVEMSMGGVGRIWTDGGCCTRGDTTFEIVFQVDELLSYSFVGALWSGYPYVGEYEYFFVDTPEERNASLADEEGDLFRTTERSFAASGVLFPGETYTLSVWTRTPGNQFHGGDWSFDFTLPEPAIALLLCSALLLLMARWGAASSKRLLDP